MKKAFLSFLLLLASCSKEAPPPPIPPYVTLGKPVCKDSPIYYEYVGHVEPNQSVAIKAQVAGLLVGQYFVEVQEVKEGDLLLKIDDRPFVADLAKAEAALAKNCATYRQAKETADRYSLLVQEQYISQLDYDQYVTNVYSSEADVQESRANVATAKINLDYCTIHAPITGVTSNLLIQVGNYVSVGGDSSLLSINQITPIKVSFYPPEKDLPAITDAAAKGAVKIVASIQNRQVEGSLFLINNQVDENTGTILLQALFPNEEKKLWPGEFVDVQLILSIQKNAILAPIQAVQLGQDGSYVYVFKPDHTVDLRPVKTGQKEKDWIIIESGISLEDTLVLEGQLNLKPGMFVSIKDGAFEEEVKAP